MSKKSLPHVKPNAVDFDDHCHVDRGDTSTRPDGKRMISPNATLKVKQSAVGDLHESPFYTEESLYTRMRSIVEQKILSGERGMNAIIDCSPDIGDRAFRVALNLRAECQAVGYELNVGAYPIFGFKTWGSDRHRLLEELAEEAQFLVALPERDEKDGHPIGFDGHLNLMINLALKHRLPLQVHVDQSNTPNEYGTERLVEAVHWLITSSGIAPKNRPRISAVHVISPSCYPEDRFERLVAGMKANNIDVIVCPCAAESMRQIRSLSAPIHNSIARAQDFLLAKIPVSIGTDNINDMFVTRPKSPLLEREFDQFCLATRYDDDNVIGKLLARVPLDDTDRESLREWKAANDEAYATFAT